MYSNQNNETEFNLCESIVAYSKSCKQLTLFNDTIETVSTNDIRVLELFAGVGGFRIGLERASHRFKTIWNNQWEPSTKRQDASIIYCQRFGAAGHSNEDINTVKTEDIPDADLLVGGFPCQDYSVATTLKNSKGIQGKKGVLWWQIYRILEQHHNAPKYLLLENVDRLLGSPATQRGRDFAIILASLADLGYIVEWRIINAAEYGMPQRRKRTYIFAFKKDSSIAQEQIDPTDWITSSGVMATSFPIQKSYNKPTEFKIEGTLSYVTDNFNKNRSVTPFKNAGIMIDRYVTTLDTKPNYHDIALTLGDIMISDENVPEEFFINNDDLPKWQYAKGSKSEKRINKTTGFEYSYSEGAMAFPDYVDKPSRTIITGEGGKGPSRFKHVVMTKSGKYRRLTPIELERLNMFPDNHTFGASDIRRAFLMGNALVTGIVERIGVQLARRI